jgi:hypothetical protein
VIGLIYTYVMINVTVYLAELIREALRRFTSAEEPPLPEGLGMFDSGRSDTTSRREQLLRQAARLRKWR